TGGFGNYDASFAHFDNQVLEIIAAVFMFAAGIPFLLYIQVVRGYPRELFRDRQVHAYAAIVATVIGVMTLYRWTSADPELWEAFRHSAFNVISVMTGTGYATTDYSTWGTFATTLFIGVMFIGGCTGSTTCSIKVFRYQVLWESLRVQFQRMTYPNGVFHAHFNRRPVPNEVVESVRGFFFVFFGAFFFFALVLGLFGLDFVTSVSGAATSLANVGPGLGATIGPSGTFAPLPDGAKWALSVAMLLGRLELFTVLILFVPSFWRD
ncbi:MAG: TrkH family potassium uptake protein, partial [Alphaproteobacteria bacterium]|nr:TrkH family potassium uptake protein [Alphaproteobacteria bacterium]